MALRWFEGFEIDRNEFSMKRAYSNVLWAVPKPSWLTAGVRAGGYYLRWFGQQNNFTIEDGGTGVVSLNPNTKDTIIIGFAFRASVTDGMKGIKRKIFDIRDNASLGSDVEQFVVYMEANSLGTLYKFRVEANSALVGETSQVYANDEWYYVEIKVKVHATLGTLDITVDGSSAHSSTGKNTSSKGSGVWGHVIWTGYASWGGSYIDLDDLYIISVEGSGSHESELGDQIIEAVHPILDSLVTPTAYNDWTLVGTNLTARYQAVDEGKAGTIDDDLTYVWTGSNNQKQTFGLGSFTFLNAADINAISFDMDVRTVSAGSKNIAPLFYSTGTGLVTHSNVGVNSTAYKRKRFIKDAPSNASWALDFAVNTEYGFESKA